MLSGTIRAPLKAWYPGLLTRHLTQNIAKSKLLCCPASLTPSINLLAATEGSLTSPPLLPPMELCCSQCLVWLNIACNMGSSIFPRFVFLQRCPWAITLAQLLGRPNLLLQPAPPCKICVLVATHVRIGRCFLEDDDTMVANSFLEPLLVLYQARAHFSIWWTQVMQLSQLLYADSLNLAGQLPVSPACGTMERWPNVLKQMDPYRM